MARRTTVTDVVAFFRGRYPETAQRTAAREIKTVDFSMTDNRAQAAKLKNVPLATIYAAIRRFDKAAKLATASASL